MHTQLNKQTHFECLIFTSLAYGMYYVHFTEVSAFFIDYYLRFSGFSVTFCNPPKQPDPALDRALKLGKPFPRHMPSIPSSGGRQARPAAAEADPKASPAASKFPPSSPFDQ